MELDSRDDALVGARPIAGAPFGWEVAVDLAGALSPAQREALARIYRRDGLILFRKQALDREQQLEACDIFGPALRSELDNYVVSNVEADGFLGTQELLFHNDIPYVPAPFLGGSLYALDAEPGAAPTRFASGFRAWEQLVGELQARIAGLKALQVRGRLLGRRTLLDDMEAGDTATVHPVVRRQDGSQRPYLFVNADMSACITTLPRAESDALLEALFAHLYDPANIYEHQWTVGDLIVWDNLAVQHARSETGSAARTLRRVSIGDYGYWEQIPTDLATHTTLREMAKARGRA